MADHPQRGVSRPLSPFLTIFHWPITMATSIVHRITGVALAGGVLLLAWWLVAAASGLEAFNTFNNVVGSPGGQIMLFGFVWALSYHLVNGSRHLAWDFGYGFKVQTANMTGILAIATSLIIAAGIFAVAYAGYGGYYR